ncbi:hypothetical protein MWU60_18035 [Yoonia sp. F2084L]|uniref:hypothetical protein n=1 Tax=Yoonia sp. F2084L TaxID=2926419 RepID=UPI001FF2C0E7|nr:hypothetical protein [Yoonia sp. F2084L]MCK0097482.1 hypothetical protein [Yoonia sp. F2084L]
MSNTASAVFIGTEASVFVTRTRDTLIERGIRISVIDPHRVNNQIRGNSIIHKLWRMFERYRNVRKLIRASPKDQTAVIHYLSLDTFWLIPMLSRHFYRVVGLAYGSDVLRRKKSFDFLLRVGFRRIDVIAATNDNVLNALLSDFPFLTKCSPKIIRFGLSVFDEILKIDEITPSKAKSMLGFDREKDLVCLGYSASPGQRQMDLLEFFETHLDQFENLTFVVPIQYGSNSISSAIKKKCELINLKTGRAQFFALEEFHGPEKSALMRRATDVLINHSVSDAFSGTVQEVVYAGNLVLSGDHLPYNKMPGFGSAIRPFRSLADMASNLRSDALMVWRIKAAGSSIETREHLHAISSWDAVFPDWQRLVEIKQS